MNIICKHCGKKVIDNWYLFDKFGNKHLWVRCLCTRQPWAITMINGLDIETRLTKKQKKEKKENMVLNQLTLC